VTGRASPVEISHQQSPKVLLETFGGPCLTWSRAAEVQKSAGGRLEQVDAGHEDEWQKATRGRVWGEGVPLPTWEGFGNYLQKIDFFCEKL